ncbi:MULTISPECIES: hypothetical protein [unclassified Streptomyces]|uniref:hypothetical protein n=1 Tax=unclassified Streptomyces TaxID=2593676 RepID=UPI002E15FA73|nr:hypothetical protein OG452_31770 [Streptomyces sp. NBC_01197]WSS47706.1 hypothetical protein OG708_03080 [Streptomyces sp. NBC_01180]
MAITTDPAGWGDLFTRDVDGQMVQFVRPADIEGPAWGAYDGGGFLGMLYAEPDHEGPLWRAGLIAGRHHELEDAVRALRNRSG